VIRSAIDALGEELRHAARALSREPAFTLPAVALLAVTVGASAALFSIADQALLRPLPYAEADRIVAVRDVRVADPGRLVPSAPGSYLDQVRLCQGCEALAAWQDGSGASTLRDAAGPLVVETVKVTPSFFRLLGAEARLGRVFDDALRGAAFDVTDRFASGDRVLMMSHALWASRFARDPGVVGLTVSLDGVPWRVAGVLAEDFALPRPTSQLFLAWDVEASFRGFDGGPPRDLRFLNVMARLRRGVGRAAAESELQRLFDELARRHSKANAGWSVRLVGLRDELAGQARSALLLLGGALALLLLAGTSNLTSLKLARSVASARDRAVRLSLGASRARLVGQQLAQSVVLAILGLAAALVVARLTLSLLATIAPAALPGVAGARLDARVSVVAAVLALAASLASSLLPLIAASRSAASGALRAGSRSATATPGVRRGWRLLVVGEVAARPRPARGGGAPRAELRARDGGRPGLPSERARDSPREPRPRVLHVRRAVEGVLPAAPRASRRPARRHPRGRHDGLAAQSGHHRFRAPVVARGRARSRGPRRTGRDPHGDARRREPSCSSHTRRTRTWT
jgi:predicted permease